MAFKVEKVHETSTSYEVGEKLWLNADRSKVVAEGDPDAAFLLATPGKRLSVEDAELYGLAGKSKAKAATKEAAPAEDKEAAPEQEKASDLIARMGDMSAEELDAAKADERKTVQSALEAEYKRRAAVDA